MWLGGLSTGLRGKGSPVRFPVRAQAWVAGEVPSEGRMRGNHAWMFLSLTFSLPSPLSKRGGLGIKTIKIGKEEIKLFHFLHTKKISNNLQKKKKLTRTDK